MPKRSDYISWDEYFMGIALLSAMRSKDPSTQVGACIVNAQNKIMSVGYNGLPLGCDDDLFPWEREGDDFNTKYPYVCHAELNRSAARWLQNLCSAFPLQRMRKGNHPVRHQRSDLHLR